MTTLLEELPLTLPLASTQSLRERMIAEEAARIESHYARHESALRYPQSPEETATMAYERHRELIERWGGWRWHTPALALERISEDQINHARSVALQRAGLDPYCMPADCPYPYLSERWFCSRQAQQTDLLCYGRTGQHSLPVRKGQSVPRAVLRDVRKRFAHKPEYVRFWELLFEELGQAWAQRHEVALTLSCAPSTFLRLGHFGESSCYRTGSEQEQSKYHLSMVPNSVVGLLYRDPEQFAIPEGGAPRVGTVAGRFWGILDPTRGAVLSNLYKEYWSRVSPVLLQVFQGYYGWEEPSVTTAGGGLSGLSEYAYVNGDQHTYFPRGDSQGYTVLHQATRRAIQVLEDEGPWEYTRDYYGHYDDDEEDEELGECAHCEGRFYNDDLYPCGGCSTLTCADCSAYCEQCRESLCHGCRVVRDCADCARPLCVTCATACAECAQGRCRRCVEAREPQDVCTACAERRAAGAEPTEDTPEAPEPPAADAPAADAPGAPAAEAELVHYWVPLRATEYVRAPRGWLSGFFWD